MESSLFPTVPSSLLLWLEMARSETALIWPSVTILHWPVLSWVRVVSIKRKPLNSQVLLVLFLNVDLTSLRSIRLGDYALRGDSSNNGNLDNECPFHYSNTLIMKSTFGIVDGSWIDLPSLNSFVGGLESFTYMGNVILESGRDWLLFPRHSLSFSEWNPTG